MSDNEGKPKTESCLPFLGRQMNELMLNVQFERRLINLRLVTAKIKKRNVLHINSNKNSHISRANVLALGANLYSLT